MQRIGLQDWGEQIFNTALKNGCDPESNRQRRVVVALLNGNNGLTRHPELVRQTLLRPSKILAALWKRVLHQETDFFCHA